MDAATQAALARLRARAPEPTVAVDDVDTDATPTARRNWRPAFLAAYADRGSVKDACAIVGISRQGAYQYRMRDPEFAKAWDLIKHDVVALLEESVLQRGLDGDQRAAEFMLKALRPMKYRERLSIDGKLTVATEQQITDEIEDFLDREHGESVSAGGDDLARPLGLPGLAAQGAPASTPAT